MSKSLEISCAEVDHRSVDQNARAPGTRSQSSLSKASKAHASRRRSQDNEKLRLVDSGQHRLSLRNNRECNTVWQDVEVPAKCQGLPLACRPSHNMSPALADG